MTDNYAKDYGVCKHCGAKNVFNPKTGKIFCEDKCWLKNAPQPTQSSQPASLPNMVQTDPNERIDKMAGKFSEMKKDLDSLYEMIKEQGAETAKLRERLDKLENPDKTFHADNLSDGDRKMAEALNIPII